MSVSDAAPASGQVTAEAIQPEASTPFSHMRDRADDGDRSTRPGPAQPGQEHTESTEERYSGSKPGRMNDGGRSVPNIHLCLVCGGSGCEECGGSGIIDIVYYEALLDELATAWSAWDTFRHLLFEEVIKGPTTYGAWIDLGLLSSRYLKQWLADPNARTPPGAHRVDGPARQVEPPEREDILIADVRRAMEALRWYVEHNWEWIVRREGPGAAEAIERELRRELATARLLANEMVGRAKYAARPDAQENAGPKG